MILGLGQFPFFHQNLKVTSSKVEYQCRNKKKIKYRVKSYYPIAYLKYIGHVISAIMEYTKNGNISVTIDPKISKSVSIPIFSWLNLLLMMLIS